MIWTKAPLGDLLTYAGKGIAPKYTDDSSAAGSVMVLGQKCVRNQSVIYTEARFHDEAAKSFKPEKIVCTGDILVNATGVGSAGRVAQVVDAPSRKCITDGHVITLRSSNRIDPIYLGYFVKSKQALIEKMAEGSTGQTEMNRTRLQNEILVTFPESNEDQKAIANYGLAIDRKIETNAKLNGYLAEQCEGIAEHQTGDVVALASLCGLASERVDCREADIATYVSTESLLPAKMGKQTASSLPQAGKVTVYKVGDTLVSNIRPYFKKIWYADRSGTCSGDVLVFRANQPEHAGYLYSCLRQDRFFDYVRKGAKGTKMPRGDKKQMLTYEIVNSPSSAAIGAIQTALEQISIANKENDSLAALRDALLPKLMSGEIDVSKVDLTQLNSHLSKCSSGSCCILPVMAALPATK